MCSRSGAQGVAVTLFTDWNLDPIVQRNYPDATKRARVGNAIAAVNAGLRSMAVSRGVYVVDQNAFGATLLPKLDSQGRLASSLSLSASCSRTCRRVSSSNCRKGVLGSTTATC